MMKTFLLFLLISFQGPAANVNVPLNTPVIFRSESVQKDVLWMDSDLDGLTLTSVKATVIVFYDPDGKVRLITRVPSSPAPDPFPPGPIPVPPVPVPAPLPSGQFNISQFTYMTVKGIEKTQRAEFATNFSGVAASIDALPTKTKAAAEADLVAKNRASVSRYPAMAPLLDLILAEANKHKDQIKTVSDLSTLYKEIALGLAN